MSISVEELSDAYGQLMREIYGETELRVLEKVAKRATRGVDVETPGWAERKLAETRALNKEIGAQLQGLNELSPEFERAVGIAYDQGGKQAAQELIDAKLTDINSPLGATRGAAVKSFTKAAVEKLGDSQFRILRGAVDGYREVITKAAAQVLTGGMSPRHAIQSSLNKFADKGITGFIDKSGRAWDLGTYAETAIRTGVANASAQGHSDKLVENGHDLMMVSSHGDCCEVCARWEGKVLSSTGKTEGYPTVAEALEDGLLHPNCRHSLQAYFPGHSKDNEVTYKPQRYEDRQQQRYNERQIRVWKKRAAVAGDETEKAAALEKVKEKQAEMRSFIKDTGRKRDSAREQLREGKAGVEPVIALKQLNDEMEETE